MKRKWMYATATVMFMAVLSGCANNRKEAKQDQPVTETNTQPVDAAHNSQNSLDYEGTYTGTIPCADCEGIKTEITLQGDNYMLKAEYLGTEKSSVEKTGKYVWDETGRIITLENADTPNRYQVGENILFALDENGNRHTGELQEMYMLRKN